MKRKIWSLLIARGCFPRREQETGALFRSAAPNLSAVLCVLKQLAQPSAWGESEGDTDGWERRAWQQVGRWRTSVSGKEIGYAERAESSSA